jgi:hypothetical protein
VRETALAFASIACGLGMGWIFIRTANRPALSRCARHIVAHLLEFRLFFDEPALILRAQGALLKENVRLLRVLALPILAVGVPCSVLFIPLEAVFGLGALPVGEPAVVSAALPADNAPASLQAPSGIQVEAGPVRILAEKRVCWRIRPDAPGSGTLRADINGRVLERPVSAGVWPRYLRIEQDGLEVAYPKTPWISWFLLWSTLAAGVTAWMISSRS